MMWDAQIEQTITSGMGYLKNKGVSLATTATPALGAGFHRAPSRTPPIIYWLAVGRIGLMDFGPWSYYLRHPGIRLARWRDRHLPGHTKAKDRTGARIGK